jgi:hypothetical protein
MKKHDLISLLNRLCHARNFPKVRCIRDDERTRRRPAKKYQTGNMHTARLEADEWLDTQSLDPLQLTYHPQSSVLSSPSIPPPPPTPLSLPTSPPYAHCAPASQNYFLHRRQLVARTSRSKPVGRRKITPYIRNQLAISLARRRKESRPFCQNGLRRR